MAICSAFWIILRQILFKFFDPDSECFAKYDAFGAHIFDYACLRRKAYRSRRGSKLWKNCIHRKLFWKWLMGGCIPLILTLGLATGHKLQKPSKESGIFQSLGTISFVLFLLKGRVKKGEGWHNGPPLNTLLVIYISDIGPIFLKYSFFIYSISFFRWRHRWRQAAN